MALKVIGAGLGRTGTLSMKAALEELGFTKCYHMVEVFSHPDHVALWDAAARGEAIDWDALFEGYSATVDWPSCNFYEQLMARYPDAKVVLTVRDPERWYESALQTIYHVREAFPKWLMPHVPRMRRFMRMADSVIWTGMFKDKFTDKAFAIGVFNDFNERVRQVVPADRLLVFEVKEGWGPLCEFLGVPVPADKPFPKVNDTAEFRARIRRGAFRLRATAAAAVAIVVVLGWLAIRLLV